MDNTRRARMLWPRLSTSNFPGPSSSFRLRYSHRPANSSSHWTSGPLLNSDRAAFAGNNERASPRTANPVQSVGGPRAEVEVSLSPYIRRLVVTGFAASAVLRGLFGEEWQAGVGPLVEEERRNFLFAAKAASWECVKKHYDMDEGQTVPRLKPLDDATEDEIQQAENEWSNWIMMQDWLVGSRAPPSGSQ